MFDCEEPEDDSSALDGSSEIVAPKKMKTFKIFTKDGAEKNDDNLFVTVQGYDEADAIFRFWETNGECFRVVYKIEEADPITFTKKKNRKK